MRLNSISNLQDKLEGKLPIDRLELLYLVNSWGRRETFTTHYNDNKIKIEECEAKECYDLSKLDVSQIDDMSDLFKNSNFNSNIANWDVSNVTNMEFMFYDAKNFNSPLNSWNISKVIDMHGMFYGTEKFNHPLDNWNVSNVKYISYIFAFAKNFEQNIGNWNLDKVDFCDYMFYNAKAFRDKYNNSKPLPNYTDEIKEWINNNRYKMNEINIKDQHGEEIDGFFYKINDIYSINKNK